MGTTNDDAHVPTIMVVDDDPMMARVISRVLVSAGYRVVTLDSGFGLCERVREHAPDLLLLDIHMPGLQGHRALGVLRTLAARFPALDVPVVFHSGMHPERLRELARQHGAVGCLGKPSANTEMLAVVRAALSARFEQVAGS